MAYFGAGTGGSNDVREFEPKPMRTLAENLWLLSYPLKIAGLEMGRKVVVVRLNSGRIVILSTGPFTLEDTAAIKAQGEPGWMVDAMLHHDTFAREAADAFPGLPYLAPEGFQEQVEVPVRELLPPPPEWDGQLRVLELDGVPKLRETVILHVPSGTLVVQDLAFNFPGQEHLWSEFMLRVAVGAHHHPGLPRSFHLYLQDRAAFELSLSEMMRWDFDRVIVGHGEPIESGGKAKLATMLAEAGFNV